MQQISAHDFWEGIKNISLQFGDDYLDKKKQEITREDAENRCDAREKKISSIFKELIPKLIADKPDIDPKIIESFESAASSPYGFSKYKDLVHKLSSLHKDDTDLLDYRNRESYIDDLAKEYYRGWQECFHEGHIDRRNKDLSNALSDFKDTEVGVNGSKFYLRNLNVCFEFTKTELSDLIIEYGNFHMRQIGIHEKPGLALTECHYHDYTTMHNSDEDESERPILTQVLETGNFESFLQEFGFFLGNFYRLMNGSGRILDMRLGIEHIKNHTRHEDIKSDGALETITYAYFSKDGQNMTIIQPNPKQTQYTIRHLVPLLRTDYHDMVDNKINSG